MTPPDPQVTHPQVTDPVQPPAPESPGSDEDAPGAPGTGHDSPDHYPTEDDPA